jgi:hypothetical protein
MQSRNDLRERRFLSEHPRHSGLRRGHSWCPRFAIPIDMGGRGVSVGHGLMFPDPRDRHKIAVAGVYGSLHFST